MLIDKNGKLFGKISIIDLLVILAFLVAFAGFGIRFLGPASESVTNRTSLTYVVKIEDIREYTVNAIKKMGVVTDNKSKSKIGEIIEVREMPRVEQELNDSGKRINVIVPEKYDVEVTIKTDAKENAKSYIAGENIVLSVGTTVNMATKYANTSGRIIDIEVEE